jgi:hypothetical protein
MSNARDKANIPVLNFQSKGIDDNSTATAITIDSADEVKIGTTTDSWSGANGLVIKEASGDGGITIVSSSTSSNGNIGFADAENGAFSDMRGLITYLHNGDSFRFMTANAERMRLTSTGLGIGTSAPAENLQVMDTSSNIPQIRIETSDGGNKRLDLYIESSVGTISSAQSAQQLAFKTAGGEAVRIDATGQVGIGTTSPSSKLEATGTILASVDGTGLKSVGANAQIHADASSGYGALITDGASSQSSHIFFQTAGTDKARLTADSSGNFLFGSGGATERMRINSSGNVGIGISSPAEKFHVVDTGSSQAAKIHSDTNNSGVLGMSILAGLDTASSSGDCKWFRLADGNDSGKAYIQFKSSSPNAEFAAVSDERLKTNIQDTDVVGLDVINNLRLVKFDWNETATQDAGWSMTGHQKLGFIAQEVEQILPEFISEDTNGFKIMGDSGFVPYLIKALQEQQTKIQELEARITTLEANNP